MSPALFIENGTNGISPSNKPTTAVAVYCGAHAGTEPVFHHAAASLGHALATQSRPLVYGGGTRGIMGIISDSVLQHGGSVVAVVPDAMLRAGGEGEQSSTWGPIGHEELEEKGRDKVESVVVDSMHERKVEMANRAGGFIALPGGYGTFEELMEVTSWTQLGVHTKPVVLLNVLGFFDPLRALIKNAMGFGFIKAQNGKLMTFVDCPPEVDPATFDWGAAALSALDSWRSPGPGYFVWTLSSLDANTIATY